MNDSDEYRFRVSYNFMAAIHRDKTKHNLKRQLQLLSRELGVNGFTWWFGTSDNFLEITTRSDKWMREYYEKHYFHNDPMVHATWGFGCQFRWSFALESMKLTQAEKDLMKRAGKEEGMVDGVNTPVGGAYAVSGVLSFYDSDPANISRIFPAWSIELNMMAMACSTISPFLLGAGKTKWSQFSPKETEALTLLVSGRTRKECADKMNISKYTFDEYCTNIMRKMDVPSIVAAVGRVRATELLPLKADAKPPYN